MSDGSSISRITRRGFLAASGILGGTAVAAGVGAALYARNGELDQPFPRIPENDVILPPNGKRVVIVGGGLAGLQAGVELAARGFQVTVLEKSGTPGGKLKSWRDRGFGPADDPNKLDPSFPGYIREHGVHAVWGFYHNLREFLGRYGWPLSNTPADLSMYTFRDKDGTVSYLPRTTWVPPYDKLQLVDELTHLQHLDEADRDDAMQLIRRLLSFDYTDPQQRAYLDSMTVEQYCRQLGLSDALTYKLCQCFLEMAYFDTVENASVLTLGLLTQVFGGVPADMMRFNLYVSPTSESFLTPMVNFIRSHGGQVLFNTEVSTLDMEGGRVKTVRAAPVPESAVQRCSICGALIFDGMEVGGECPYCGANADMIREVTAQERVERTYTADYFVCALDGPGAQLFVTNNSDQFAGQPYFDNILKLNTRSPQVCNLWYEGKGPWERSVHDDKQRPALCVYPTGYEYIGITINRALRVRGNDRTFWSWSSEYVDRDVTVIETQVAKSEKVTGLTSREIAMLCHAELKSWMPDLPDPVSWYVNRWFNYTAYRVGDEGNRPPVQSPFDNLFFIGDISFVPHHAVFMEKTNVTAKWVTNLLLDKVGQAEGRITILATGTPSLSTDWARARYSVYVEGTTG